MCWVGDAVVEDDDGAGGEILGNERANGRFGPVDPGGAAMLPRSLHDAGRARHRSVFGSEEQKGVRKKRRPALVGMTGERRRR